MTITLNQPGTLGKLDFKADERDELFSFKSIRQTGAAARSLKSPPARFGFGRAVQDWGMLANDNWGDCVEAGILHQHEVMALSVKHDEPSFSDDDALRLYAQITGGGPQGDGSDPGTEVRSAMRFNQQHGVTDSHGKTHKIASYHAIDPNDPEELMLAAYNFLVVGFGFRFAQAQYDQFDAGEPWDYVPGSQIIGGHYIVNTGRIAPDNLGFINWGTRTAATEAFVEHQGDEAWAVVSEDELDAGRTVRGFDLSGAIDALRELRGA